MADKVSNRRTGGGGQPNHMWVREPQASSLILQDGGNRANKIT
jgi:hypothetical protein